MRKGTRFLIFGKLPIQNWWKGIQKMGETQMQLLGSLIFSTGFYCDYRIIIFIVH